MDGANSDDVLVIGAGLAGLACARDLRLAGRRVTVLEKSRGLGGRTATRRWDGVRADLGAQYFTARSGRLRQLTDAWRQEGWLTEWTRGFPVWEAGVVTQRPDGHPRLVPQDGMSALARRLARDLDVITEARVTSLVRGARGWRALTVEGRAYEARTVLLALPAPQLAALVADVPLGAAGSELDGVTFEPTFTLLAQPRSDLPAAWRALEVRHDVLRFVSRDHTKRPAGSPPVLVAHATGEWSRANLEGDLQQVQSAMLGALREVTTEADVHSAQVHRWRFATPTRPYRDTHHLDRRLQLGWCGDWCAGPDGDGGRVEAALLSGWALADAVTGRADR